MRKSYRGIKKDRLFYSLGTSGKRSSHIPASKRVNLKTSGLHFNLRDNIILENNICTLLVYPFLTK